MAAFAQAPPGNWRLRIEWSRNVRIGYRRGDGAARHPCENVCDRDWSRLRSRQPLQASSRAALALPCLRGSTRTVHGQCLRASSTGCGWLAAVRRLAATGMQLAHSAFLFYAPDIPLGGNGGAGCSSRISAASDALTHLFVVVLSREVMASRLVPGLFLARMQGAFARALKPGDCAHQRRVRRSRRGWAEDLGDVRAKVPTAARSGGPRSPARAASLGLIASLALSIGAAAIYKAPTRVRAAAGGLMSLRRRMPLGQNHGPRRLKSTRILEGEKAKRGTYRYADAGRPDSRAGESASEGSEGAFWHHRCASQHRSPAADEGDQDR